MKGSFAEKNIRGLRPFLGDEGDTQGLNFLAGVVFPEVCAEKPQRHLDEELQRELALLMKTLVLHVTIDSDDPMLSALGREGSRAQRTHPSTAGGCTRGS